MAARRAVPTIISRDTRGSGALHSEGEVQIDGSFEGDVRAAAVVVGEHGSVTGSVEAETIDVRGRVEGRVAGRTVSVAASARIVGDIEHEVLSIAPGAFVDGQCKRRRDGAECVSLRVDNGGKGADANATAKVAAVRG